MAPAEVRAETATLVPLVDDPGRFQAAWTYVPNGRRGASHLASMNRVMGTDRTVELPTALKEDDVGFSVDIRARGTASIWAKGGTALLWMHAHDQGPRTLRVGLPKGAAVMLDGALIYKAGREECVPEAIEQTVEVSAGAHWLAVTLPPAPRRWEGRGFHLRWIAKDGKPAPGLSFALPVRDPNDAIRHALAPDGVGHREVELMWQGGQPTWEVRLRMGPNVPKPFTSVIYRLRTPWAQKGERVLCSMRPGGVCSGSLAWRWGAVKAKRLGAVVLEAQLPSGWTKIAQWNGDRELTGDDVALRQTAAAAQRRPEVSLMPVSSQATFAYSLQVWDDWLAGPLPQTRPPVVPLSEAQSWLKAWIKAVTTGRDPISGQRGLHRRAYRSPLDGRYQPYALMIPPDYDPSQQHPLMVGLHGHTGTPTRMCRAMLGGRARPPKHRPPFVLVCPFGYGETAFRYVGEDDLFRVLAEVERDLSIDPDRIALTGLSDGGLAAFEVALHHPDRWSAVAPLAGVADMRAFPTIGTGRHTPYEARWLKRVSAVHRAMNGSALRFVIAYGAQDRLEERWVEGIVDALRHHGAQVDYTLHPTLGHNVWDTTYAGGRLFEQLVNARRPSRPEVIRYRSYSPRRRGGWDVVIDDADWDAGAELHVDHRTQGEVGVVGHHIHRARIGLRGATRLTVGNAAAVTVASTAVELRWEGAPGPVAIKPLTQVPGPPTWPLAEGQRGRIAVAGPLDELRAGAAVYLYGTGDPASTALYRYLAALEQRRWGRGVTLRTRLAADTELDPAWLTRHHLVLVGQPKSISAPLRSLMPAIASPQGIVDGGLRTMAANPRGPGLLRIAVTGTTARGVVWGAHLPEILPEQVWATAASVLPPFGLIAQGRPVHTWSSTFR